jgi:hypothetical protein
MADNLSNKMFVTRNILKSKLATPVSPLSLVKITQSVDDRGNKIIRVKSGWRLNR